MSLVSMSTRRCTPLRAGVGVGAAGTARRGARGTDALTGAGAAGSTSPWYAATACAPASPSRSASRSAAEVDRGGSREVVPSARKVVEAYVRALVKAHHRPAANDVLVLVGGSSLAEKRTAIKTLSESAAPDVESDGMGLRVSVENRVSR